MRYVLRSGGRCARALVGASAALAAASSLAGCGDSKPTIPETALRSLVLQPTDLPDVFVRFDHGPLRFADLEPGRGLERFGRKGGWKARYRRPGSFDTRGPLVVESLVDLFDSSAGAAKDLAAYRADFSAAARGVGVTGRLLPPPALGDEAYAVTYRRRGATRDVRFVQVGWRTANVTASLTVNGFVGGLSTADVLALARKQQRRIERAASS